MPYDVSTSFKAVIHLVNLPMVMIANPKVGDGTLVGFMAELKVRPTGFNYASAGPGGASHLMMELFNALAKSKVVHVPFRGGAPVLQAVVAGDVQVAFSTISTSRPFIDAGSVRAIAVGSAKPVSSLPDVPTVASIVAGFEAYTWHGIHVPAATPETVVAEINRTFNALLARPELAKRLEQQTAEPVGGSSEAYERFVKAEIEKWGAVVRASGIRME